MKNKTYKQFGKSSYPLKKNELHIKFKTYRNSIVKLTCQCKGDYFKSCFESNKKSLKRNMKQHEELHKHKSSKKLRQIALNINNQTKIEEFCIANQFDNFLT